MANIERAAQAVWSGDLRSGKGQVTTASRVLEDQPVSYAQRFENEPGTNPEELIAAAHAACFSMAFSSRLAKAGHQIERIVTTATLVMEPKEGGGHRITRMRLDTVGWVEGIGEAEFKELATDASLNCPVSVLLKPGLDIELTAALGAEHAGLGGAFGM